MTLLQNPSFLLNLDVPLAIFKAQFMTESVNQVRLAEKEIKTRKASYHQKVKNRHSWIKRFKGYLNPLHRRSSFL